MAAHHYAGLPAILLAGLFATASPADIDDRRMQRDIRIMEGVLNDLHGAPGVDFGPGEFSTRGLYLDGYGVFFIAAGPRAGGRPFMHAWVDDDGRKKVVQRIEKRLDATTARRDSSSARIRDTLAEFLGQYASSIHQLAKDDRVTVLYRPRTGHFPAMVNLLRGGGDFGIDIDVDVEDIAVAGDEAAKIVRVIAGGADSTAHKQITGAAVGIDVQVDSLLRRVRREAGHVAEDVGVIVGGIGAYGGPHAALASLPLIEASAKKSDIDAFRRGKIDSAKFRQRVVFAERQKAGSKKIDIMAGILDQVLTDGDRHHFGLPQRTLGMYQPGLGALFFASAPMAIAPLGPDFARDPDQGQRHMEDLKDRIVETVADYGASLRQVKSGERIIVECRPGGAPFFAGAARRLTMSIAKSAVDAYNRGKIDLATFRAKAVWKSS